MAVRIRLMGIDHSRRRCFQLVMINSVELVFKVTAVGSLDSNLNSFHSTIGCFSYYLKTVLANITDFNIAEAGLLLGF